MRGQRLLFVGGQGPVSAPVLRLLAPDNDVFAMARFSKPEARQELESSDVTCIQHDLFDPFDVIFQLLRSGKQQLQVGDA